MSWEKCTLADIVTIKKGEYITKKDAVSGKYPVILGGKEPAYYINKYNHVGKAIVISRSGASAGYVSFWNEPIFITDGFLIEPKQNTTHKFLFYLLKSKQSELSGIQRGAAIPHVTPSLINSINVSLPDLHMQNRIASILSAYDDLIENNQKQIKLLEEAAQRLYKEWFVDLRFPGWENTKIVDGVPEGWTVTTLDDVIDFDPKVPLSKDRIKQFVPMSALSTNSMCLNLNEITFTQSNSGSKFQNGDTLLARITPCLENGKTAFVSGIISDEGAVGSTEYIVMRSKKLNPYMVYLLARTNDFRQAAINSMSGSDGRQRAKVDKLKCLPYLLPLDNIIQKSLDLFKPIFSNIESLSIQSQRLDEIKNMLLSKLMNDKAGIL